MDTVVTRRRSRALAFSFIAVLLLAILPATLPVAQAASPTVAFSNIFLLKGGVRSGDSTSVQDLKIGDTFDVRAYFNVTVSPCTVQLGGSGVPTASTTADLANFSSAYTGTQALTTSRLSDDGTTYSYIAFGTFTVAASPTGKNGLAVPADVTLTTNCRSPTTTETDTIVTRNSTALSGDKLVLDNTVPQPSTAAVTAGPATGNSGGIGSTYQVDIQTTGLDSDLTQLVFNLYELNVADGTRTYTVAGGIPSSFTGTVGATGKDSPRIWVHATDARGNTFNRTITLSGVFDTNAPFAISGTPTVSSQTDGSMHVSYIPPAGDVDARVNISRGGTILKSVVCTTAGNADCTLVSSGSPRVYKVTGYTFTPNVIYNFTVAAQDARGNMGPTTSPVVPGHAKPILTGTLEAVITGTGGTGSSVTLTAKNLHSNVTGVAVSVEQFTGSATLITLTNGQSTTFTVASQAAWPSPQVFANLTGANGDTAIVTPTDTSGNPISTSQFDTKAPAKAVIAQIVPQKGGYVEITVATPTETDVTSYVVSITKTGSGSTTQVTFTAPPLLLNLSNTYFTSLGTEYQFTVTPIDAKGNTGPASDIKTTIPANNPLSIIFQPTPASNVNELPIFTGSWTSSQNLTGLNPKDQIRIYLQNATTNLYWDGSSQLNTAFITAKTPFVVEALPGPNANWTDGTWSANNFSSTHPITGDFAKWLWNGTYNVIAEITTQAGTVGNTHVTTLDYMRPALGTPAIANPATSGIATIQQGTTEVAVNLAFTDEHAKPKNLSLQLVTLTGGGVPALDINGNPIVIECPGTKCKMTPTYTSGTNFTGTASFYLTGVAAGDYKLNATLWDRAGNTHATQPTTLATTLRVVPRVVIAEAADSPFAHPDGIAFRTYAALDAKSSVQPANANCPLDVCRVTSLEIRARPYSGTGSTGAGTVISNVTIPISGPDNSYSPTGPRYYNYTPSARVNVTNIDSSLDPNNLQLLATAYVKRADGTFIIAPMPGWVRVGTGIAPPSSLNINKPASEWQVEMPGTVESLKFNVTYEQNNLVGVPKLNYTMRNLATGQYVDFSPTSGGAVLSSTPPSVIVNVTNTGGGTSTIPPAGPKFNWTWANNATVPAGEYVLNVTVKSATGDFLKGGERSFAVQTAAPRVRLMSAESQVFDGRYVGRSFNVSLEVDTGFANLSQSGVTAVLETGIVNAPYLQNGQGGFSATMTSFYELGNKSTTRVNYTIALPSTANDGARYDLRFNVTTDSYLVCSCSQANGTYSQVIILDNANPSGVVDLLNTNATGRVLADPLRIIGFAEDSGAGVGMVEVRLINLSEGTTFKWDLGSSGLFHIGTLDSFLSSKAQRPAASTSGDYFRNVYVERVSPTSTLYQWVINQTDRPRVDVNGIPVGGTFDPIPLDRFSTYRLDVRVTDNVGRVSPIQSFEVRFDPDAPVLLNETNRPGGLWGPTTVNWHSMPIHSNTPSTTDVFTTNVSDNHCVKSVMLKGRAPSGAVVSAEFARPTAYVCNQVTGKGNEVNSWSIDLAKNPHMTNEVGVYNYWVEAIDYAGRNASVPQQYRSFNVNVTDTLPARVSFEHFTPQFGQVGGSATLYFEVEENKGLDRIDIYYTHRVNGTDVKGYGPVAPRPDPAKPPAANGTGGYILDTATDLNLDLELGEYRFDIRPIDWDSTGCKSAAELASGCSHLGQRILLQVVSDAAPSLVRESPAAGTTFVNATPEFRFRVIDPSVEASGIILQAGDSAANLTTVTPTLEALTNGDNRTGYRVTYKPSLADMSTFVVRLRATDTTGLAAVETLTFEVDSVAPTVSVSIAGNETGPDGRDYAVDATRVTLTGTDALSGLAGITYSENNGTARTYSQPVIPDGADGAYELKWTARDNASNVATGVVHFRIDTTGPVITSSNDPKNGSIVKVTASDAGIGLNESTLVIRYATGNASIFANATFTKESGNLYSVTLPAPLDAQGTRYYVEALDHLGNKGMLFSASAPKVIAKYDAPPDNGTVDLSPVVTITAPTNNGVANGTIELRWTATDPENAPLTVTIALREPTGPGRVLVDSGENSGSYALDVSSFAPGTYALVVSAIDSTNQGQDEVTFRIADKTTPPPVTEPVKVVRAPADNIKSGEQVSFTVQLDQSGGKTIQSATYKLVRGGEVVSTGALVPLSSGYSGSFAAPAAGQYSVLVSATYTDGSTMDDKAATTFTVQEAQVESTGILPGSLILLLVLGMLTVALAAYAAFVRWGK